jgi:hypothetical protein
VGWFVVAGIACSLPEGHGAKSRDSIVSSDDPVAAPATALDADGDGYQFRFDCDDEDATVHPNAEEICLNGIDESCIEGADHCVWSGTAEIEGLEIVDGAYDYGVGLAIAVCDVNTDGQLDLVMSGAGAARAGAVYVFHGPLVEPRTTDDADYTLEGTDVWKNAGSTLACRNDVNGDGTVDIIVAEGGDWVRATGAAYVVSGDGTGTGAIDDEAMSAWTSVHASEHFGFGYAVTALDQDGNGRDDVAVTIADPEHMTDDWGATYVLVEPAPGENVLETVASASLYGSGEDDQILAAHDAGDLDSDGIEELAVDCRDDDERLDSLYVFSGPLTGALATTDADMRITGTQDGFGESTGHADLDGDGREDLFVGNPDYTHGTPAVHVFFGGTMEDTSTTAADVQILDAIWPWAEHTVASPGDVNRDGRGELLVGASGAFYLIGGGESGVYDLEVDAQLTLTGDQVGPGLATGEVTGDGITDFIISNSSTGGSVVVMPSLDL